MAMPTTEQVVTLVTGANGGIGFELVAQLLATLNNVVLLGSRSLEKGQAAVEVLQARGYPGKVHLVHIDVDDVASVGSAVESVGARFGRLDALVNNAAIGGVHDPKDFSTLSAALADTFRTNATGPAMVVAAFAPLLAKSPHTPRIVNVTSGHGSIGMRSDPTNPLYTMTIVPYRASKAALNMITACQAYEYRPLGWKVFAYCPGFTASNLSPWTKVENGAKPTSEGARPILAILEGRRDAESGAFLNGNGEGVEAQWPW